MKVEVTETDCGIVTTRKSLGYFFRSSTLTRDYTNKVELRLMPQKAEDICVNQ